MWKSYEMHAPGRPEQQHCLMTVWSSVHVRAQCCRRERNKALNKSFTLEFVHFYNISALTKNSVVFSRAHIVVHPSGHFSVCSINFLFPLFRVFLLNWKSVSASFAGFIELMLMFLKSHHIPSFNIASINRAPCAIRDVIDPEIARLRFISLVSLFPFYARASSEMLNSLSCWPFKRLQEEARWIFISLCTASTRNRLPSFYPRHQWACEAVIVEIVKVN